MKRFIFKLFIFLLPFIVAISIELFILPLDYFTFRIWEAVVVKKFKKILTGPFYPGIRLKKFEEGDLAHHTKFSIKKEVDWYTDRYGYRKKSEGDEYYPIVIVGDSNIAGSGLKQDDILSEVLEKRLNSKVYPMAPEGIGKFLKTKRFIKNPPEILIFEAVEREIFYLSPLKPTKRDKDEGEIIDKIKLLRENRLLQSIAITLDRIYKANMLNYIRANLRRALNFKHELNAKYIHPEFGPIFFLQGPDANKDVKRETLEKAVRIIKSYSEEIKKMGIRFIFLPIPEKENIFHELLGTPRPVFLENLISELKKEGVETIDTQEAFEKAYKRDHILLYQTDDSHWNENGVRLAATLIESYINR